MFNTNDCIPIRRYLESFIENNPDSRYNHYEIAPLSEYAKFGNQLKDLYIIRNITNNKLQLWYSDIN